MIRHKQDMSGELQRWCARWAVPHWKAAAEFGLPVRTFDNWYYGVTKCPIAKLLRYRLKDGPTENNT